MSEFILQIEKLISATGDAEYRYMLLEPLIFYGIIIGVIMLIAGFCMKAPKLQTMALITIGLSALTQVPYQNARVAAQPRIEQVYKLSSPTRFKMFKENTQSWVAKSWQFKLLVLLCAAAFMIGIGTNKFGYWAAISACVLGLVAAKNAMWLNYQDALAFHPNLKVHEAPIESKVTKVTESIREETKRIVTPPKKTAERSAIPPTIKPIEPAAETLPLSSTSPPPRSRAKIHNEEIPSPSMQYRVAPPPPPTRPLSTPAPAPAPQQPKPRVVQPLPIY